MIFILDYSCWEFNEISIAFSKFHGRRSIGIDSIKTEYVE